MGDARTRGPRVGGSGEARRQNRRRARTAGIGEAYDYGVWQDYPSGFGQWTHVAGGARYLFFYNSATGAAALGTVDATGAFTELRSWAPGTSFGAGWTNVCWHGDELFFYASGNGLAAVGRFDGPDYARAVTMAKASAEYREVGEGVHLRHRARFFPGDALRIRDLYEIVGPHPTCDVLIDDRPVPFARDLWLPLVWFLLLP